MILVENWAPLAYDPCSPHNNLVAVGYHLSAALINLTQVSPVSMKTVTLQNTISLMML